MAEVTGRLKVEVDGSGRSNVTRRYAKYPLRFLFMDRAKMSNYGYLKDTREHQNCPWVYPVTYGGGLVSGDSVVIECSLGEGSRCVVTTQASTKVYKSLAGRSGGEANTVQKLCYKLEAGALLCVFPEPITCFKDARFTQHINYQLSETSNLVHVDWSTSGRLNRERWDMQYFESNTIVTVDSRTVFREHIRLEAPKDGSLPVADRMACFNVMAAVVVVGKVLVNNAEFVGHLRKVLVSSDDLLCSRGMWRLDLTQFIAYASPIGTLAGTSGLAFRILSKNTEDARTLLHKAFLPLGPELGQIPYD